jgi:cephalosporin-C deacetylase
VKCPSQIALGLADTVCPAEGILATFNELKGPKELVVMPTADHQGDHAVYYQKFNAFLQKNK